MLPHLPGFWRRIFRQSRDGFREILPIRFCPALMVPIVRGISSYIKREPSEASERVRSPGRPPRGSVTTPERGGTSYSPTSLGSKEKVIPPLSEIRIAGSVKYSIGTSVGFRLHTEPPIGVLLDLAERAHHALRIQLFA